MSGRSKENAPSRRESDIPEQLQTREPGKKLHWPKIGVTVVIVVGIALIALALTMRLGGVIGQLLAVVFVVVAIYGMVKSWWAAGYCFTLLLVAAALFFSSQEWMQGFIKHEALSFLLSVSEKAGEKLGEFQKTTVEIQGQVTKHQEKLNHHQAEIGGMQARLANAQSNLETQQVTIAMQQVIVSQQQGKLTETQNSLSDAQRRLGEQQQQLANVETLVNNIYNRVRSESFKGDESGRVLLLTTDDKAIYIVFRLAEVPIPQSVQGTYKGGMGQQPILPGMHVHDNIVAALFVAGTNVCKDVEFYFTYVADPSKKDKITTIKEKDGILNVNGQPMRILPPK